jgi:outer membrane protein assembly factor BamB
MAVVGTMLIMLGVMGPAGAVTSAASDLPPLGDIPLYRVNVTANGIQPGPGPTGKPELAWRVEVGDMHMVPILVDGQLIVGTNDGHLIAHDGRTGATMWDTALGSDVIQPSLASMDGHVYAADTSAVYAVDLSSGSVRWSVPVHTPGRLNAVDGVLYAGMMGGVVGFDGQMGTEVWRWEGPADVPINAGPIADGVGYFATGDARVFAIDLATKQEVWRLQTISDNVASGQVVDDTFYVSNNQGEAAEPVGEIYAVDRASGDVRWRFRAPSGLQLKEGPFKDGVLYASGTDDGIWALRDDGSSVTVLWHVDAPAAHWPMSMAGTTLYEVRLDGSVGAYDSADGTLLWETDPVGDIAGGPIVSGGMVFLNNDSQGVMAFADPELIARLPARDVEASPSPAPSAEAALPNLVSEQRTIATLTELGLSQPLGMDAGPDGLLYVLDTTPQVTVIDPSDGHVVRRWGRQGAGPGEFDVSRADGNPGYGNISVAPDGRVYVADGSNHRVQVFTADGTFLFQFGSFGTGDGQFGYVNELAIAADGSVYAGQEYGPISKFTPDGKFLWRTPNKEFAYGYAVRPDGLLVATCGLCRQLLLLDPGDGHLRQRLDAPQMDGDGFGPVELDADGNMYVQMYASGSQMVFDPAGMFLGTTPLYTVGMAAAPVFLPDGRGYLFSDDGLLELKVTLPDSAT